MPAHADPWLMTWPLAVLASEPGRSSWGGQRLEHPSANRLDSVERFGDAAEQHFGVVVGFVYRRPCEGLSVGFGPLSQQCCLPVARFRPAGIKDPQADDPARDGASLAVD